MELNAISVGKTDRKGKGAGFSLIGGGGRSGVPLVTSERDFFLTHYIKGEQTERERMIFFFYQLHYFFLFKNRGSLSLGCRTLRGRIISRLLPA